MTNGCPTLDTPLLLKLEHDFNDNRHGYSGLYNAWNKRNDKPDEIRNIDHEAHIYIELYDNLKTRFASNGVNMSLYSFYDDKSNIVVSSGGSKYVWEKVGEKKYRVVVKLSGENSGLSELYSLSRDFKVMEIFYFQSHHPEWKDRNNYDAIIAMAEKMPKRHSVNTVHQANHNYIASTDKDPHTKSLFLYQKFSRAHPKATNVDFTQRRGLLQPRSIKTMDFSRPTGESEFRANNWISTGGRDIGHLQNIDGKKANELRNNRTEYNMVDTDKFDNYLTVESFNFKLMNSHDMARQPNFLEISDPGSSLAQYNYSAFNMTKENKKFCGMN
ncbi:Uncharacterised protein [Edwardsiella tarda]|nr:Uncharacterised protein [Edwardsiella tarda]